MSTPDSPILRQFSQVLQSLSDGEFHQECSDKLNELQTTMTDHLTEHGGEPAATMTISLKLKMEKGMMTIRPELVTKPPKEPRRTSTLYVTEKGLTPFNPKQMEMFNGGQPKVIADTRETKTI